MKKKSIFRNEISDSEIRYRCWFESAKDGILIIDAETGKTIDVNPFLTELLGHSKNDFIERSIWEIDSFKEIYENKEKFLELQQEEYVRYDELPLLTSKGREIYVEFVSNIYLVENQKVIQCNIRDITARKETEAVLGKTGKELADIIKSADEINEFNENIIDTIREPLLAIDKDLRVIKASRSFYHFFKVTAEETIGKLIYELGNHQWDIPKLKELLEKIIPEKNNFDNYEVEHNFSTIGKRVMLLNARQVKRAFGKEQIILLAIEDITERKRKEDSLQETQRTTSEFLNILLNLMNAPIIIWDTSMTIIRFNHQFELMSGYDAAEVIGRKIDFLFPNIKIAATLELLKNNLDREQSEVTEIDILTKDNHTKTVLWNSSCILDEKGKNIIATISQDITSRRQSEIALRKSEFQLRTLVKTIPDLIWLKDTNGVYLSCNQMFERFFGARETDIIGKTDYDFVDSELSDFFRENDRKAMEAGKPTSNEEWVTFADDGHRAFLETIKTPIYDSDGMILGILGIGRDITERKLAGQVLQASEKRFRAIFDQAPIAIALIDLQGHPIISNLRLSNMLGYTTDELSKMKFTDFTYPEDIDKDLNQFTDLIAGKIPGYNMEKRYIHKNGNLIWANLYVTTLNDNKGLPQEIIGMVEDITGQKTFHNEIKFQANLLNNVGQAVIATDLSGKVIYWNHAAETIYGWSISEAIGLNIIDLVPARETKEQGIDIMKKLSHGKTWAGEFFVKRKDGISFPAFITNSPILDSNGKLTGICGISSDITERKNVEMELRKAKEKAEESEQRFRSLIENAPDGVVILNESGKFIYVSPNSARLFGYNVNEVIGHLGDEFTHPDDLPLVLKTIETIFHNPLQRPILNYRFRRKNGEYRWIETTFTNLLSDKAINGFILNFTDVTERRQILEDLVTAKDKAEESDRLKSAFLTNMSHEIRTPMNGILGFSELLLEPDLNSEKKEEYINILNQSGQRMLNTVNDIVEISKIEAGIVATDLKEVDVQKQLDELIRFFTPEATKKGLKLILENEVPETVSVTTDKSKLDSILTNLIKNAIKFTPSGEIKVGCTVKAGKLEFCVKDTGIGIPELRQKAVFDRFVQAELTTTREFEGSGLGLAITKAYVNMLGGEIGLESATSQGSTFFFTLPVNGQAQEKTAENETWKQDEKTSQVKGLNIIIAEDDYTSALYLKAILKKENHTITFTKNGHETVEACRSNPDLDLVLMDIEMPVMNGYDATREIRKFNKDLIIIAQTAFALTGDKKKAMDAGCNDYISKPINKQTLFNKISKLEQKNRMD